MQSDSKAATVRSLDRIKLRLAPEAFTSINAACAARPGSISRNTWIAEAVGAKLAREPVNPCQTAERRARG